MTSVEQHRERLTRNTAYLTAAFVVQKVLSSVYYFVYANLVGPAAAGAYLYAFSIASLASILIDLGLSPILIREVAKNPSAAPRYLRAVLRLKLVTAVITIGVVALMSLVVVRSPLQGQLLTFAVAFVVLESLSLTAYGVLRGLQRLRPEAIGTTLAQLVPLGVGGLGLWLFGQPLWLGIALVASGLTNAWFALRAVRRIIGPTVPASDRSFPWSARTIMPFAISGVLQRIYAYVDVILVGLLASTVAVGLYSAAFRVAYALQFLPIAFNTSLYPALSRAAHEASETLQVLAERAWRVLLTLALPLSVLLIVQAGPLLATLFPAYRDAQSALQVSLASLPPLFVNFLLSSLLNATNRQARQTLILASVVIVNMVVNLVLIPPLAQLGASIAALSATTTYTGLGLWATRPHLRLTAATARFMVRLVAASAIAAASGWLLSRATHVLISLALSTLIGGVAIVLCRVYRIAELRLLLQPFRRRPS